VEIIHTISGSFSLETTNTIRKDLAFAVIDSNIKHRVIGNNCTTRLLMLEKNNDLLNALWEELGIQLKAGVFTRSSDDANPVLYQEVRSLAAKKNFKTPEDHRVEQCIKIMEKHDLQYENFISYLTSKVYLSESRLSHLFKQHTGASLKKYFVWAKLKKAIDMVLSNGSTLTEASFESGFFDQPHMNRAFKNMLGITPVKAYNSRTIQF